MALTIKKLWYESLFENYGQKYDNENFNCIINEHEK